MAPPKQFLVTATRKPFATSIEHRPDGTIAISQYTHVVLTDALGSEIATTDSQFVELSDAELTPSIKAQVDQVTALARKKIDEASPAVAAIDTL